MSSNYKHSYPFQYPNNIVPRLKPAIMASEEPVTPHTSSLRNPTNLITGHNGDAQAIYQSAEAASWSEIRGTNYFNVIYTTSSFPIDMSDDADIRQHEQVRSEGRLGLVRSNGTVCRMVDFAPNGDALMHRTKSLDYGIVVEGEIELHLDSGEVKLMKRCDVAVQRGTMHAWKNASKTEWARIVFVLQDSQPLSVGGKTLGEELGHAAGAIPASGN